MKRTIRDIILVIIGSFIFAAGVNAFVISGDLGEG
ncbi:YitT family protein, partial [Staphylococcus chromogenes]